LMRDVAGFVDRMIASSSIEQIRTDIDGRSADDRTAISNELNRRLREATRCGRLAEAALLTHVLTVVTGVAPPDRPRDVDERVARLRDAQDTAHARASAGDATAAIRVLEEFISNASVEEGTAAAI